ncbi:hypothetical protein [Streptomyces sp. NBC_00842]|uniref:hypothetical protein n=1 Tax=Streptomyces sp. NBC_00842 TaxID=2975848 RepID=UPI0038707694|nr:hypothetical protein OH821_17005 [Streptomyces sp. NBC_00842]
MTARFVRERRCVICDHRVHPVPDDPNPARWSDWCDEGCQCTTALCQPYRVFTDGTTDRRDMGPFGPNDNQQENHMTTQQAPNANDFLMGGGGAPSASFPTPGTKIGGTITEPPTVQQQRDLKDGKPKFWDDGNPMMHLVVTIQTEQRDPTIDEDNGMRRLFVKGQLKNAIAEAVRAAGAPGLQVGGILDVAYTHDGPVSQRGFNPPKQYAARYTPAAANFLNTPGATQTAPVADPWATQAPVAAPPAPAQQALHAQQQAAAGVTDPPF